MSAAAFSVPVSVRYLEVDQQGVVFNMWYLAWFDDAMTAYLAELGFDYEQMLASGFDVQVVHSSVDYRAGVRFRDAPEVHVAANALGTTSFRLGFRVTVGQREMVAAEIVYVCVATDGSGKQPIPAALRAALEARTSAHVSQSHTAAG